MRNVKFLCSTCLKQIKRRYTYCSQWCAKIDQAYLRARVQR